MLVATQVDLDFWTPELAAIVPTIHTQLAQLHALMGDTVVPTTWHGLESCHQLLCQLQRVTADVDPALRLFLAYPTQRLSSLLGAAADEARAAAATLAQQLMERLPETASSDALTTSLAHLQEALDDWRIAVMLESARCDLEDLIPETVH